MLNKKAPSVKSYLRMSYVCSNIFELFVNKYTVDKYLHQFMLDLGCGNETRIVFCLAGSSTSMSLGHLTNGRGMSEATKPVIKHAVFHETSDGIITDTRNDGF